MDTAIDALADDPRTLRAALLAERATSAAAAAYVVELEVEVERLQSQASRYEHIIDQLRRLTFGKHSEQMDKNQLQLALEDLQQGAAEIEAQQEKADIGLKARRTRQRRSSRPSLPKHLPRVDVVIEPATASAPPAPGRCM